ncbi:hypothetical protein QAD02_019231 [Eretmocerus hayati]|uniref:Uncharacterized protein n=1 Tax=Eretmocerus hayati TaxID=131215 RepID=A0ACC2PIL5_9HYME|nr:hypothetical protein QAD02_019231 [Eretmocerus hayati]
MASLPSPAKVAGKHHLIYEGYYKLVDPNNTGHVGAMDAAKFLKKSHLSDIILSKIWDMADPASRGFLDKSGIFVALKLCALAQQGLDMNPANMILDIAPPKMGDATSAVEIMVRNQASAPLRTNMNWTINPQERTKYEQLFLTLKPVDGCVPGNKVRGVLMDSKLPLEVLGKIWDLADMDKDGKLNEQEFIVAMHLVYKALEKNAVPNVLPPELLSSAQKIVDSRGSVQSKLEGTVPTTAAPVEVRTSDWVVSTEDQRAADKLFTQADQDLDGFVSGLEIKDVFFQSGLPQQVLALIWGLCDIAQSGKLNNEQFALAMWLIKEKLSGAEIPNKLTPGMIPPSFRKKDPESGVENNNSCTYANPELNMISEDISEIIRERHILEQDISQKEADIKIKSGEIKSLQSELDTLAATLRQLDNQKGEAQKRLNDLKAQVDKLKQQVSDQEVTLLAQEEELNAKRQEIECLKMAEQELENQQRDLRNKLNDLSKHLQDTQLQTSQTKANMTQLEEQQHQILDAITQYDAALAAGDSLIVPDSYLYFKAKLEASLYNIKKPVFAENPEAEKDVLNNNDDAKSAFESDPFGPSSQSFPSDPFNDNKISYDPFNDGSFSKDRGSNPATVADPFGEDPFAALHAPVRSTSPSPALPPKKSKQPPPRPAPPRPASASLKTSPSPLSTSAATSPDPFGDRKMSDHSGGSVEFANFANFDSNM